MIEFVDMGIEGFLNDLTLVVTSYFDMFVAKHHEEERQVTFFLLFTLYVINNKLYQKTITH